MMTTVTAHGHFPYGDGWGQYGGENGGHVHLPWGSPYATGNCRQGSNHVVCFPFGRRKRDLLEQAGRLDKKESINQF
ncbi:unnamed protein product [Adineta steineri]|uniref:Uncharacterized protein n=1 Tax=Adineta steineri TaxID=433720 RepID=A0A814Q1S1_9BILA|nr:unnamed protein product [Adineta steineri]CAF1113597.1 unnamed protein product [Adineta steineri]